MAKSRLIGDYPVIGIRPTIDGRRGPLKVRESLEVQTMDMAKNAAKLIQENVFYSNGEPVKVIDERVEEYNYCRLIFEDLPSIETPFIIKVELDGAPQVFERIYDAGFTRF